MVLIRGFELDESVEEELDEESVLELLSELVSVV